MSTNHALSKDSKSAGFDTEKEAIDALERSFIEGRRQGAHLTVGDTSKRAGLALSGGGIRSAAFNLGVLQALYRYGLLRQFDYLSTVSGGGYIGGFFAALAMRQRDNQEPPYLDWTIQQGESLDEKDPIKPGPTGMQPLLVQKLIRRGKYLSRPFAAFCEYMTGLVALNLVIALLLLATGAAFAWLFRWLDHREVMHFITALGFDGDVRRAFFPAFCAAVFWSLVTLLRYLTRPNPAEDGELATPSRTHRRLSKVQFGAFYGVILLLVLGVVSLMTTGDISIPGRHSAVSERVTDASHTIAKILLVAQILALLPLLKIDRLLHSGVNSESSAEQWLFAVVGSLLIFGLPLLSFAIFVQEDFSGIMADAERREFDKEHPLYSGLMDFRDPSLLNHQQFLHWDEFWTQLKGAKLIEGPNRERINKITKAFLPEEVGKEFHTAHKLAEFPDAVEQTRAVGREAADIINRHWAATMLLSSVTELLFQCGVFITEGRFPSGQTDFAQARALQSNGEHMKRLLTDRLNKELISDREFYKAFLHPSWKPNGLTRFGFRWTPEMQLAVQRAQATADPRAIREANCVLLAGMFPGQIEADRRIYSSLVWYDDQWERGKFVLVLVPLALILALGVNLNGTSLQRFYCDRIREMWLPSESGDGGACRKTVNLSEMGVSRANSAPTGAPYLLVNATANHFIDKQKVKARQKGESEGDDKGERRIAAWPIERFTFSPLHSGCPALGFVGTTEYEKQNHMDLAGMMAISGSAVNPVASPKVTTQILMFLANVRLGRWVRNPLRSSRLWFPPSIARFLADRFLHSSSAPEDREFVFLSDGGHYDNLGLEALFERRCRVIICSDATMDPKHQFLDLLRVIRRSRVMLGIRVCTTEGQPLPDAPLDANRPVDGPALSQFANVMGRSAGAHHMTFGIYYPGDDATKAPRNFLIYLRPTFTLDESMEMQGYRSENPNYPFDPTSDQFYDPRRFESYRQLGEHVGESLARKLRSRFPRSKDDSCWLAEEWVPEQRELPGPDFRFGRIVACLSSDDRDLRDQALMDLKEALDNRRPLLNGTLRPLTRALASAAASEPDEARRLMITAVLDEILDLVPAGAVLRDQT